jgi:hypothetical protein
MKALYDIYTIMGDEAFYEECCATPGNTAGMGNPMLPTAEEPGTEPLVPTAKTKTEKKQKRKTIKEGILDDIDASLGNGDKLVSIIEWYKTQRGYAREATDDSDIKLLMERLSFEGKDTLVIDCKGLINGIVDEFYIKDNLPKGIKHIKVINSKGTVFKVYSFTTDLSNINFSVFEDNGRMYGDIIFHAKIRAGKDLKIGDLTCSTFSVNAPAIETLTIGNNSVALEIHLGSCPKLNELYGPTRDAQDYTVCKNFIRYQLAASGKFAWGATMNISNR